MSLKGVFRMYLTKKRHKPTLCHVKTIACEAVQVNEGNDKNARSPSRSPNKLLNNNKISFSGERENDFSRAHVGNFFNLPLLLILFLLNIITFIIFFLSRARILLFTRSLLKNFKLKTISYQVNDLKKSFPSRSPRSPEL